MSRGLGPTVEGRVDPITPAIHVQLGVLPLTAPFALSGAVGLAAKNLDA